MTNQKLIEAAQALKKAYDDPDNTCNPELGLYIKDVLFALDEMESESAIPPDRIHACPKCGGYTSPEAVHKCEGECTCLHAPEFETPNDDYATKMLIDPACPLHGAPERKEERRELGEEDILQVGDYLSWDGVSRMPASPVWFGHPVRHLFTKAKVYRPAPARQGEEEEYSCGYEEAFRKLWPKYRRALDVVRMTEKALRRLRKDAIQEHNFGKYNPGCEICEAVVEAEIAAAACREVLGEEKK